MSSAMLEMLIKCSAERYTNSLHFKNVKNSDLKFCITIKITQQSTKFAIFINNFTYYRAKHLNNRSSL